MCVRWPSHDINEVPPCMLVLLVHFFSWHASLCTSHNLYSTINAETMTNFLVVAHVFMIEKLNKRSRENYSLQ